MTRRLIVNADDFGLTRGVSEGILAAHRHGIVTSTTALVTSRIESDHIARARDSGLGIGLHVNFTLGRPLTSGPSLVDETGRFGRDARRPAARTLAHLCALPPGLSEFMAHPGRFDDDLAYSRYARQREAELIGLGTPQARGAVGALGIRLSHFGNL